MVTKIITGKSIRSILLYNENKVKQHKAGLILSNKFGVEIEKLNMASKLKRFELLTFLKPNVRTNALHIMLNFDGSDSLNIDKLQRIAIDYMERIGFGDQPYLVYQHHDTAHPHLHVVTTNINAGGRRMDMHGIGRTLSEKARKALEISYDLVRAEGRQKSEILETPAIDIAKAVYGKAATKRTVTNVVWAVIRDYKYASFAEFNAVLGQFGVLADRGKEETAMFAHRGLVYSLIDVEAKRVGIPFKASELSGRPLLDIVERKFERSKEIKKTYRESVVQRIASVLARYSSLSKATFDKELSAKKIGVVYRVNAEGRCYGVTFVDHRTKCVFNGSDLGKAYSAKNLMETFAANDVPKRYLVTAVCASRSDVPRQTDEQDMTSRSKGFLGIVLSKSYDEATPDGLKSRKRKRKGKSGSQELNR